LGKILMSKFILNLLVQISKALVYSTVQFFIRKGISFNFWPNRPSGQPAHSAFLAPSSQAGRVPPSPFSLPHRAGSAAASSRATAVPWTPPFLPCHGAATVAQPLTPPSSIGCNSPLLHSSNSSHEGANYHRRPPFPAAPPPSRPYKRVPALRWSTSPLHLASFPPQSCPHHGRLELKLRRRCAASSPSPELR
jgi:hypothetical protein